MAKKLAGLRVAALAADGFEQLELTSPMKELRKHGAEVEVVSLRPGKILGMNVLLPGKKVPVDRLVQNAEASAYDALLLPGGFVNPDLLRQSDAALQFVRDFDAAGKPIAVICHGPWLLVSAGLVRGRRLTSWPGIKDDVVNAGGEWEDRAVVRDGAWVASRSPKDLRAFNRAMVELFAQHAALDAAAQPEALAAMGAAPGRALPAPAAWLVGLAALAGGVLATLRLVDRLRRQFTSVAAPSDVSR